MPDQIETIVRDCRRYWLDTNVARKVADDMSAELEQHLREAQLEGRSPDDVVGESVTAFAEEWARENRSVSWSAPPTTSLNSTRNWTMAMTFGMMLIVAIVALATAGQGDEEVNAVWRWVWTIGAVVLSLTEIVTAGFFLLPFGMGAAAAAVLAWIGSPLVIQWGVMLVVSIASLVYFQRYARLLDAQPHDAVGVERLIGQDAVVLQTIDPHKAVGIVRVETEEWRATTRGETIQKGSTVRVLEIRGTRLVVQEAN